MKTRLVNFLVLLLSFSALTAFAAPKVEITSFYLDRQSHFGEVCGIFHEAAPNSIVQLVVDPDGHPGEYNVIAGKTGNFCTAVLSYQGVVQTAAGVAFKATNTLPKN